ncbi:hypothetical protein B4U80_14344 [Leptotrombidium deliense]|uniref:Uncharacterized protein n=1 Tax=Leptotrombidium deliense TaxID=299467 RepID=A0A443RXL6_9ACAR|nr:hypothetical protein B4U80_14344 [Leptotrombidium deliense]
MEEIDLKIKTWSEWNYLHFACSFGNVFLVEKLTEVMPDLYTADGEGYYPILRAIACGHIEVVKTVFNEYPQLNVNMRCTPRNKHPCVNNGSSTLEIAIANHEFSIVYC